MTRLVVQLTRRIEDALPYQVDARTRFEILADGLRCSIAIRLRRALAEDSDGH